MGIRSMMYRLAMLLGDLNATRKQPGNPRKLRKLFEYEIRHGPNSGPHIYIKE
jgi:hypothetical protein